MRHCFFAFASLFLFNFHAPASALESPSGGSSREASINSHLMYSYFLSHGYNLLGIKQIMTQDQSQLLLMASSDDQAVTMEVSIDNEARNDLSRLMPFILSFNAPKSASDDLALMTDQNDKPDDDDSPQQGNSFIQPEALKESGWSTALLTPDTDWLTFQHLFDATPGRQTWLQLTNLWHQLLDCFGENLALTPSLTTKHCTVNSQLPNHMGSMKLKVRMIASVDSASTTPTVISLLKSRPAFKQPGVLLPIIADWLTYVPVYAITTTRTDASGSDSDKKAPADKKDADTQSDKPSGSAENKEDIEQLKRDTLHTVMKLDQDVNTWINDIDGTKDELSRAASLLKDSKTTIMQAIHEQNTDTILVETEKLKTSLQDGAELLSDMVGDMGEFQSEMQKDHTKLLSYQHKLQPNAPPTNAVLIAPEDLKMSGAEICLCGSCFAGVCAISGISGFLAGEYVAWQVQSKIHQEHMQQHIQHLEALNETLTSCQKSVATNAALLKPAENTTQARRAR